MKTLIELYGASAVADPVFTDIAFKAAFPENFSEAAEAMKLRSEKAFNSYYDTWRARLAKQISDCLDRDLTPDKIVAEVNWMTAEEMTGLLTAIDTYVDGDDESTQATFALKLMDAQYYFMMLKEQALQLLSAMVRDKLSKAKILTPFSNPNGGNAGGQIITS